MSQIRESYEQLIYGITDLSKHIRYSDLIIVQVGKNLCVIKGNVYFVNSIRLEVREAQDYAIDEWITGYRYAVYRNDEKLYWYDSQGHPNDPDLQSTHPHHKHIPPDIKHHRIPATKLSFKEPNLTYLINEIEQQFFI